MFQLFVFEIVKPNKKEINFPSCKSLTFVFFDRYGSLFKTHILGCPTIVSMDPELNRYILMNEGKGLVPGYPQSMLDILGKCNIAAVHGSVHKHMRGSLLSLIGPLVIKDELLPKIDEFMRSFLENWNGETIDIQERTNEVCIIMILTLTGNKREVKEAEAQCKNSLFMLV